MKAIVTSLMLAVATQAGGLGRLSKVLNNQNEEHFDKIE
jgi:hypothetical protein